MASPQKTKQTVKRASPAARTRTRKAPPARRPSRRASRIEALFPKFAKPGPWYGVASLCAVAEADGHRPRLRVAHLEQLFDKPARRPRHKFAHTINVQRVARLFNALANRHRIAMLQAMFAGAGTHAALTEQLGLKAGPLYHHVRELRLAGLVALEQRDLYRLTDRGNSGLMLAACFDSLLAKA